MSELLELDERGRASLGKFGRPEHRRYLVDVEPDGTLVLRPAQVMSEAQARLLTRDDISSAVDPFLADPSIGVRRGRPPRRT